MTCLNNFFRPTEAGVLQGTEDTMCCCTATFSAYSKIIMDLSILDILILYVSSSRCINTIRLKAFKTKTYPSKECWGKLVEGAGNGSFVRGKLRFSGFWEGVL